MKILFSNAIYVLLLLLTLATIDVLLVLFMESFGLKLLNLFLEINIFWKLLLSGIFISILSFSFGIISLVGAAFCSFALKKFEITKFTAWVNGIIVLINVLASIKVLWDSFTSFTFWAVIEFVFLIGCVLNFNQIFLVRTGLSNTQQP